MRTLLVDVLRAAIQFVIACIFLVVYGSLGAVVAAELAKHRPELFTHKGGFHARLAVLIIAVWPLGLVVMMAALAVAPVKKAWEDQYKS
jgi:hypothetical protein